MADSGDDHAVDLSGVDAGLLQRLAGRATDIICTVSSGVAKRRSLMPDRCWIHSSLESMASTMSALGTTREGR